MSTKAWRGSIRQMSVRSEWASRRRASAGVGGAHADESVEELTVEENVTEQFALAGTEHPIEQREVRRPQTLEPAVATAADDATIDIEKYLDMAPQQ
ncbi:hypothetical protein [Rhodococcus olei]|uniref:hypothetical protein n=1 Tax=Rhodococcus olei TaxID=2161675 RepID=UPI0031E7BB9D